MVKAAPAPARLALEELSVPQGAIHRQIACSKIGSGRGFYASEPKRSIDSALPSSPPIAGVDPLLQCRVIELLMMPNQG
jgi:hypothetical protein